MALIRKIDCARYFVPDLEAGLAFYRDRLGHELVWRTEKAAGLRLTESEAEIVLQAEDQRQETDLLVESADDAAKLIARGRSNREIADAMTVGVKTIKTYVTRILNKLGFDSRVRIATWAVEKGLITSMHDSENN